MTPKNGIGATSFSAGRSFSLFTNAGYVVSYQSATAAIVGWQGSYIGGDTASPLDALGGNTNTTGTTHTTGSLTTTRANDLILGIYALNAARYLSGEEPVEGNAMMRSTPGDPRFVEVEENITFQLRFPSGVLANCASSYGAGMNRFRVFKPRGSCELEPALSYSGLNMRVLRGGSVEERIQPVRDHFASEMDAFSECVINDTEPLTPGEEGLRDLRIMTAIYEAAQAGRTVKL